MQILKSIFRILCSQLLKICILFVAVSTAIVVVLGTSSRLKSDIKASGIYDKAVNGIIDQVKKDQNKNQNPDSKKADISLDDPGMRDAIKKALPASFLENSANGVIDGVFGWLKGTTPQPIFTIDLTETKKQLAVGVGEVAYQKALALPICTRSQLRTLNLNNVDVNNLPCLPPGIDLQAERDKYVATVSSSKDFLPDTKITNENLPKKDDKTVFDQANKVPTAYQLLVKLPYILSVLGLLAGVGVVFLHDERRRGLWVVSRTVFVVGLVLLVGILVSNYIINNSNIIKHGNGSDLEQTAQALGRLLVGDFNHVLLLFGIPYIALGAGGMLAIRLTRPKTITHDKNEKVHETITQPVLDKPSISSESIKHPDSKEDIKSPIKK